MNDVNESINEQFFRSIVTRANYKNMLGWDVILLEQNMLRWDVILLEHKNNKQHFTR